MKYCLSLHVFYFDNQDTLLLDCIEPLVLYLSEKRLIDRHFFIRYWEGGPHIRLRLFGNRDILLKDVSQYANQYIHSFFARAPSTNIIDEKAITTLFKEYQLLERGENESVKPLYNNNSIEVIEYIPEINRYGGKESIYIAEKHFHYSSLNSFVMLRQIGHSDQKRLALSLKTMIISLLAFDLSFVEIISFMRNYSSYWKKYIKLSSPAIEENFIGKYRSQKLGLCHLTTTLIDFSKSEFRECKDTILLDRWDIARKLFQSLQSVKKYSVPKNIKIEGKHNKFDLFITSFLFSILHMDNNRLGIKPYDESYLAFLISEIFSDLCYKMHNVSKSHA